jgi:hypothetical protein
MARKRNQDEESSQDVNKNDDTFGLPEIEYKPLDREEPPTPKTEAVPEQSYAQTETKTEMENQPQNEYNTYYEDENQESPWPKILAIAGFLLITAAAIYYFGFYRPGQLKLANAEKERIEQEAKAAKSREADLAEQRRIEAERRAADSLANLTPAAGMIDTLTERTGRYYVVVASSIDGDLILDYAKKLSPKGVTPRIIPPHGKIKFYRLAVADGDTYASTQATANQMKGEYGEGAWVVKY